MNILVDTCVWSEAFRRGLRSDSNPNSPFLRELIREGRALMFGPIRQELLSGIRDRTQFEILRDQLRAFPDLPLSAEDYEEAAALCNRCRAAGIQGSNTDFLICAAASRAQAEIFTSDKDFQLFTKHARIKLFEPARS